ncbi:MAG: CooT family nickel-binding protein [Deltaproteobacteria bacterium]|jgi:predicted RNA-binding protein|nr:CooT family nickel-binding protein [Deltaproteobacteria bacterium]
MCEANIFIINSSAQADEQDGDNDAPGDLFLEAVDKIIPEGENLWRLTSIFGEQKTLCGRIHSMRLVDHQILFERLDP